MTDKKIQLITQMLAKAESTTPEEAEALTEHAERLMLKYSIDQAVIDAARGKAGQPKEVIVQESMEFTGAYRGEMIHLGASVMSGLGNVRALQNTSGGKVFRLFLVGFQSDVDQAKLLIASLQVQSAVAVRAWWKANSADFAGRSSYDQEKTRRSFVHGFGTGAGSRIRQNRVVIVEEASTDTGTALVLVSRKDQLDVHMAARNPRVARARNATGGGSAAAQGFIAGQQANTGGKTSKSVTS